MPKLIPLTMGYSAIVDDDDFERASKLKWHAHFGDKHKALVYAAHTGPRINGTPTRIFLHRFIVDASKGDPVDHINRNGLDCRKSNLRIATNSQNCGNCPKSRGNKSSRFKGVFWKKYNCKWEVVVAHKYIGIFSSEQDAARAYDDAARKHYGQFARTNFQESLDAQ